MVRCERLKEKEKIKDRDDEWFIRETKQSVKIE
nr:MAG TPA: hypothetical protein [Caudoviricetes sp.]